jgi:CubicO group peptidase (beta-lactamase class C family)
MICKNLVVGCLVLFFFNTSFTQSQKIWKPSAPEEQDMNSLILANAIKQFKQDSINIHSLVIIKNNHLVLDVCFYPFQNNYVHDLASVTKSITSLLIGIAIDKKLIKNENEPVFQYFPEYKIENDTLKKITIKNLLNMCSGFQCSWNEAEKELNQMIKSKDWVKFMFSLPFATMPGQQFSYCSSNFYLLAEILQRTTKMTCYDFANRYLFKPMGFGKSYWSKNDSGVNIGWGDLHISIYDMAKIGCLLLNNGNWNGKQIVPKQWIEKIKPLYKIQKTESYGYGWWLDSENPDEIQAVGRGGQRLFVFRNTKMVIAAYGGGFDAGDLDNIALESIKAYNKNENYDNQLRQQIKAVESPDTASHNDFESKFSLIELNKTFQFYKNDLALKSIRFEKRSKDEYLILNFTDGSKEEHLIGMNNQYKISKERGFGLPMAVKGRWLNDTTLEISYNRLCRIENYKFIIVFNGDSIEVKITEPTKKINETLIGKTL